MSKKKDETKKCPGVSKQGNPCRSNWNEDDPDGLGRCKTCQARDAKSAKSNKKKAKKEVVAASHKPEDDDYNATDIFVCGALATCQTEVVQGTMGTPECAKTLNRDVWRHEIAKKHNDLTKRDRAQAYANRLMEGGPFAVCPDCQHKLVRYFGTWARMFVDLSYAQRKFRQEQERALDERRRQENAERVAKENAKSNEQALEATRLRVEQEKKALEDAFAAEFGDVTPAPKEIQRQTHEINAKARRDCGNDWLEALEDGLLDESILNHLTGPFWLQRLDVHTEVGCANPHCPTEGGTSGTMNDSARHEDGTIMTYQGRKSKDGPVMDLPVSLMHVLKGILAIRHRKGGDQDGGFIYDRQTNKPVTKLRSVPLCLHCVNQLKWLLARRIERQLVEKGMEHEEARRQANREKAFRTITPKDGRAPYTAPVTTPLARAARKAAKKQAEWDSNRGDNGGRGGNGSSGGGGFGEADPEDIAEHKAKCDSNKAIATLGDHIAADLH